MRRVISISREVWELSNVELVKNVYYHYADGNLSGVTSTFAPNIEWVRPEKNINIHGKVNVTKVFKKLEEKFIFFEVIPKSFIDAGEHVIVFSRYYGVFAESNQHIDVPVVQFIQMENQRVVKVREHIGSDR
ncbi:nuclear transport factor 2 family protein [Pseudalkalibacillus berkeleyi]|uniref:Nuclear transport factor 2 family protein n=1 Tax=Pseudalkalibacillus berkeleyi TaxID=1069813 RepID=A0ABS9GU58_9BACL|nr:nuclear transport factor 2 family protein [Pseudalkalibacillus berkeleyi]MCF6136377.1 nuclear transport factor 2 family protein [Pseudalkalibacillus berkeleyi]